MSAQGEEPEQANVREWSRPANVKRYASRHLRPVEVILLVRYRDELSGRVLELACAAGRMSGYLIELAESIHGIDLSPSMVAHCGRAYPRGTFSAGDLSDLSAFSAGSYDAVVAAFNALDLLGDEARQRVLAEVARVTAPGGLLIMSTHNRAHASALRTPLDCLPSRSPAHLVAKIALIPWRWLNRRRRLPLERREREYVILNDDGHEFRLLHYYISRDAQTRQLADHGFDLVECLDGDGRPVDAGQDSQQHPELHYVARRRAGPPPR